MKTLRLAKDLSLPLDAVTQTIAVLAKRRAGKSYTMRRLTEQLLQAGQQVVIVDPKGDQWGLRSAADGKAPGLPIVILGGERGDVPLEASSGEVVAKLVVEERVSVLLDLSQFRKHEVATFMTAFLENVYRLKAKEIYRTPVMLVIDEADAVAPQKPQKGEERMLGAAEDIVRRGGQRGIGCVLVTQRSAVLNKNVLTQAQVLVVLRTIAPQDLAAMKAWIEVHGDAEQGRILMESLPSLPIGDAWFWSPGWPTTEGIFKRVHVLPIETFDSGASPKPGVKPVEPKNLADVDLDALKGQMAATIEKAKAEDPRELRKQIAKLKKQVTSGSSTATAAPKQEVKRVEVLTDADRARLAAIGKMLEQMAGHLGAAEENSLGKMQDRIDTAVKQCAYELGQTIDLARHNFYSVLEKKSFQKILDKLAALGPQPSAPDSRRPAAPRAVLLPTGRSSAATRPNETRAPRGADGSGAAGDVTGPQQRILNALAWAASLGLPTQRREKVAFLADASPKSSAFMNNLGALRSQGLIDYPQQGFVGLTNDGAALARVQDDAPATSAELQRAIYSKLPAPQVRIVEAAVRAYPSALDREAIAEQANASPASSAFMNNLGALRSLGLIDYPRQGAVAASPLLFLEER